MRTFGWWPAARRIAASLDRETLNLLEAYCAGVNAGFAAQQTGQRLHPLFEALGVRVEPWDPASCLLSWWHVSQFFATDGTRDLMVWRNRAEPGDGRRAPRPSARWVDDTTAVVQRAEVSDAWVEQVDRFAASVSRAGQSGAATAEGPKFSHAWVVGGAKVTTGSAVLVSDPQTPVRNPSLWMEFHVCGKSFNARGVGVPGSPGLLIGFNRQVAWGLTALGADQADLFRLETDPAFPDQYRWNGTWRPMIVRQEEISIRGEPTEILRIRETHLGPVVSEFAFRGTGDPEVALKRVPWCETDRDTIQAAFAMMRAADAEGFMRAVAGWRFPTANCVFGDKSGRIGFSVVGAIPVRSAAAPDRDGNAALRGVEDGDDWMGFVPAELLPRLLDPRPGYLLSANHRPVGTFYPLSLGLSTGSMGDTIRSWRLRERLETVNRYTPEAVLEVHYDAVNPARREIVRLGRHLREHGGLSEGAVSALKVLEPWFEAGASSDLRHPGAELATRISTFFRFVNTPLAAIYGGGESGLARFLKDAGGRLEGSPGATFSDDERRFVDEVLAGAWQAERGAGGTSRRGDGSSASGRRTLAWFDSLDGYGSLGREGDLVAPALNCVDGQTLHSQAAQSYTQWVPLHDPDAAQSICPIGHSDRPDSPYRTSTMSLWAGAQLHPAPLNRAAVERIAKTRFTPGAKSVSD
ncbi:MAG: penicillin acylase family protein, partial [Verrucomicrobia bacterium]|nr:penicillin acylase family protein [Verrucomicrobiota bacterium]